MAEKQSKEFRAECHAERIDWLVGRCYQACGINDHTKFLGGRDPVRKTVVVALETVAGRVVKSLRRRLIEEGATVEQMDAAEEAVWDGIRGYYMHDYGQAGAA